MAKSSIMKRIEFSPDRQSYALWHCISDKGNLVLDHYDHSEKLKKALSDECDWFVVVAKEDVSRVIAAQHSEHAMQQEADEDMALLNSIKARGFRRHSDYEEWLQNYNIPFNALLYTGWGPEPDV